VGSLLDPLKRAATGAATNARVAFTLSWPATSVWATAPAGDHVIAGKVDPGPISQELWAGELGLAGLARIRPGLRKGELMRHDLVKRIRPLMDDGDLDAAAELVWKHRTGPILSRTPSSEAHHPRKTVWFRDAAVLRDLERQGWQVLEESRGLLAPFVLYDPAAGQEGVFRTFKAAGLVEGSPADPSFPLEELVGTICSDPSLLAWLQPYVMTRYRELVREERFTPVGRALGRLVRGKPPRPRGQPSFRDPIKIRSVCDAFHRRAKKIQARFMDDTEAQPPPETLPVVPGLHTYRDLCHIRRKGWPRLAALRVTATVLDMPVETLRRVLKNTDPKKEPSRKRNPQEQK
jgi:hypothetical protein